MQKSKKPLKFGRYVLLAILLSLALPYLIPEQKLSSKPKNQAEKNALVPKETAQTNTNISYLSNNYTSEIARVGYQFTSKSLKKDLVEDIAQFFEQHPDFIQRKIMHTEDDAGNLAYRISVTINCEKEDARKIVKKIKNSFGVVFDSYPVIF